MPYMPRLELRVSEELLALVDAARGGVPRGTWVKRVVEEAAGDGVAGPSVEVVREARVDLTPRSQPVSWHRHHATCRCGVCKPARETGS